MPILSNANNNQGEMRLKMKPLGKRARRSGWPARPGAMFALAVLACSAYSIRASATNCLDKERICLPFSGTPFNCDGPSSHFCGQGYCARPAEGQCDEAYKGNEKDKRKEKQPEKKDKDRCPPCDPGCVGKPVNVLTGTMSTEPVTDVVLDDAVLPIAFTRYYASEIALQQAEEERQWADADEDPTKPCRIGVEGEIFCVTDSASTMYAPQQHPVRQPQWEYRPHSSGLGHGWTHTYNEHLQFYNDGDLHTSPDIVWVMPDGNTRHFYKEGSTWKSTGRIETIEEVVSGEPVPPRPSEKQHWKIYKLYRENGGIAYFLRPFLSFELTAGNAPLGRFAYLHSLQYGGSLIWLSYYDDGDTECVSRGINLGDPSGNLCKIQSSSGNKLFLRYKELTGVISSLSLTPSPFNSVTDANGWTSGDLVRYGRDPDICRQKLGWPQTGSGWVYGGGSAGQCENLGFCCAINGESVTAYVYDSFQNDPLKQYPHIRLRNVVDRDRVIIESHRWDESDEKTDRVVETDSPDGHIAINYDADATCPGTAPSLPVQYIDDSDDPMGWTNYLNNTGMPTLHTLDVPTTGVKTEVINYSEGGHSSCRYFDNLGFLTKSDPSNLTCGCDEHSYVWPAWGVFHVGADGYTIPTGKPRTLSYYTTAPGGLMATLLDDSGRDSVTVEHALDMPGTAGWFGPATSFTHFLYAAFGLQGRGLKTRIDQPSILDAEALASDTGTVWNSDNNSTSIDYCAHGTSGSGCDVSKLPLAGATTVKGGTWVIPTDGSSAGSLSTKTLRTEHVRDWTSTSPTAASMSADQVTTTVDGVDRVTTRFFDHGQLTAVLRTGVTTESQTTYYGGSVSGCTSGFDVFGNPRTVISLNGDATCLNYDAQGRPLQISFPYHPSDTQNILYNRQGDVRRIQSAVGATVNHYGGGKVMRLKTGDDTVAGTANFLTATDHYPPPLMLPQLLLAREETVYRTNSADPPLYATKPLLSRRLGPPMKKSDGTYETCAPHSSGACSSDDQCTAAGAVCILDAYPTKGQAEVGHCEAAEPTSETDDCLGRALKGLCRARLCHELLTSTKAEYNDTTDHDWQTKTTTPRVLGTDENFVPDVRTGFEKGVGTIPGIPQLLMGQESVGANPGTALGRQTLYDEQHRPIEEYLTNGSAQRMLASHTYLLTGVETTTTYGAEGRAIETTRQYDDFGRLIKVASPDAGTVYYEYNEAGELVRKRNADGTVTTYVYDEFGRLTAVTYPDNPNGLVPGYTTTYSYDQTNDFDTVDECPDHIQLGDRYGAGRLTEVEEQGGRTWFSYDIAGRVVRRVEQRPGDCGRATAYHYDAMGRLDDLTYPSGRHVFYKYDGLDPLLVTDVGAVVNSQDVYFAEHIEYSGGRIVKYDSPNGVSFSGADLLTGEPRKRESKTRGGSVVSGRTVTAMDDRGNPTVISDGVTGNEEYRYDDMDALASATRPDAVAGSAPFTSIKYKVDGSPEANRKTVVQKVSTNELTCGEEATRTSTYTYDQGSNRLAGVDALQCGVHLVSAFEYDAAGNTTHIKRDSPHRTEQMLWNEAGDLAAWQKVSAPTAEYGTASYSSRVDFAYDYRHLRTKKEEVGGIATAFYYADGGSLQAELTGNAVRDYVWLGGRLIGVVDATTGGSGAQDDQAASSYWVQSGLLGEPLGMTDALGAVTWRGDHDPFGIRVPNGVTTLNLGLPGWYRDAETGLVYNWNRYQIQELGRYESVDPLLATTGDPYAYARGNPAVYVDPDGLSERYHDDGEAAAELGAFFAKLIRDCYFGNTGPDSLCPKKSTSDSNATCSSSSGGPKKGIYQFPDKQAGGKPYVGQSKDIDQRLDQHERDGRLDRGTEEMWPVDGSKTDREMAEHERIQKLTEGVPARQSSKVANKVDPIGPSRRRYLFKRR